MFRQVRDAVLKATGQKQEPFLYGSLGAEPVYFVPAEATPSESSKATEATIFISYASADRDRAEELAHSLQVDGYTVWWDTKLLGGQQYRKAILAQLEMARATIVIWTKASVESDWVYDEASRARAAGKLIPIRVRELDPKEIQPPFGALHTVLFDDRAGLHAALAGRNVLPAPSAAKSAPSSPGPVDERTLEHDYWVAIQASKDPTDFETFLQKFTHGVYDSVARKRVETLIAEASSDLIAHFLREHPNSDRAALARARLVEIEWRKAEQGNDSVKLRASIARYPDSAQIPHAKAALARLEWERIRSSEDAAEIEQVLADLGDTNEAMLARQRLASLHEEDAAWTRAASANDAASLRHYLSVFPRGKHATEVKARLKAMGHPWLWQSLSAAWARLPTKRTVDTLRDFPADYSDGANTHMATAEPAAPLAASQRAKEEKAIPVISFSELLDVIKAFFSRKGYGAERNVFLDPVPDKITKDAKLLFPRSQNERIVAALTSTFSNDAIVFTDCAIYFRAKPFFEKKDRVSYEQLKKREPQSKMSTGNVIFADTSDDAVFSCGKTRCT